MARKVANVFSSASEHARSCVQHGYVIDPVALEVVCLAARMHKLPDPLENLQIHQNQVEGANPNDVNPHQTRRKIGRTDSF